jgi:hypothetical protein
MTRSKHTEYHNRIGEFAKQIGLKILGETLKEMGSLTQEERVSRLMKINDKIHLRHVPTDKERAKQTELHMEPLASFWK